MIEISARDFMERQPTWPMVATTDRYYLALSRQLARAWDDSLLLDEIDDETRRDGILAVVGYFQDIVADAGLWRTFTRLHSQLNGSPLPHYQRSNDYVDYELNVDDLRTVLHYTLGLHHHIAPQDPQLLALAQVFFTLLDEVYVTAPGGQLQKPAQELKAFAKTRELQPGESQTLTMDIPVRMLASFDEQGSQWLTEAGDYTFKIGSSSRDIKATAIAKVGQYTEKVSNALAPKEKLNLLQQ